MRCMIHDFFRDGARKEIVPSDSHVKSKVLTCVWKTKLAPKGPLTLSDFSRFCLRKRLASLKTGMFLKDPCTVYEKMKARIHFVGKEK